MPAEISRSRAWLQERLALVPSWQGASIDLEPLPGGRTNTHFLVRLNGSLYVARIGTPDSHKLGIRRSDELSALRAATMAGIAPKLVWIDDECGVLVSEFVPGRHWSPQDIRQRDNMRRLADTLRAAHELRVNASEFDPISLGREFENRCASDALSLADRERWRLLVPAVVSRHMGRRERCLCHNDINRGNFIDDGARLFFIDWECAGIGDPFYDLAVISHNNRLTAAEESELISAYQSHTTWADLEHLQRMKVSHDFYHVFWYASQLSDPTLREDFRQCCNFHANRLDEQLREFNDDGSYIPENS
jgi:thiamine kinase-like enzyme